MKLHFDNVMNMLLFKKQIVDAGIKKHQSVIDDFRIRIKELMSNDGNVNEEEYDSHSQSHKAETVAEVSLLSDQLEFAIHELVELKRIESYMDQPHSIVEFGTVVVTDKDIFFVSASIERFTVNDKSIFGLSIQSPLYMKMKGKRVGETFEQNGVTYRIKEIF